MAEYDVNFGKDFNLTVDMDEESFEAFWDDVVEWEFDGEEPSNIYEKDKIKMVMQKWAEEELDGDDFSTNSATFRLFTGSVTSASKINSGK